jgi:hypothetical protein
MEYGSHIFVGGSQWKVLDFPAEAAYRIGMHKNLPTTASGALKQRLGAKNNPRPLATGIDWAVMWRHANARRWHRGIDINHEFGPSEWAVPGPASDDFIPGV